MKRIYVWENWSAEHPHLIGELYENFVNGKSAVSFEFDDSFLERNQDLTLDPEFLPFSGRQYTEKPMFGVFSDSCPDRWGRVLIQRREALLAEKENRLPRELTETDYLLGVHDEGRMGAIRFSLSPEPEFLANDEELAAPPWVSLRELEEASRELENHRGLQSEHWLRQILAPGSSLGGSRPKANVKAPDGSLWIAKFPSKHDDYDVGAWEKVAWDLEKKCKIQVPEARIKQFSDYGSTFLVKRFDRNGPKRIQFASAMTMLNHTDGQDSSYFEILDSIRSYNQNPIQDSRELWKRIAFSMAISNHDDHLRNHGFLLNEENQWTLSPAYDVNPVSYAQNLSLTIDGKDGRISPDLITEVGELFYVEHPREELQQIVDIVQENWEPLARQYSIPNSEIRDMKPAFTRLAQQMSGPSISLSQTPDKGMSNKSNHSAPDCSAAIRRGSTAYDKQKEKKSSPTRPDKNQGRRKKPRK